MMRYDIINQLINKNNYQTYLEVGTQHGTCFEQIKLPRKNKVCLDIAKDYHDLDFVMSSDDFFKHNTVKFDIIFIDGDHSYEQSYKDIQNALKIMNIEGSIVCHDCFPHTEELSQPNWMGTVYKSIVRLIQERRDLDIKVVNTDCGCGIIQNSFGSSTCDWPLTDLSAQEYSVFIQNPQKHINLISIEDYKKSYKI